MQVPNYEDQEGHCVRCASGALLCEPLRAVGKEKNERPAARVVLLRGFAFNGRVRVDLDSVANTKNTPMSQDYESRMLRIDVE